MVHARLTVFRTVDGVTFAELDLSEGFELVDLPADERVVVWISVRRDEGTAPVDSETCVRAILLCDRIGGSVGEDRMGEKDARLGDGREVLQPIVGIRELFDLLTRYADGLHDLELVSQTGSLGSYLALLGAVDSSGGVRLDWARRIGGGRFSL